MDYADISKETISYLYKSYNSLKRSPLDPIIRILLELRTSQINGCKYCCELHTAEAQSMGVSQKKLDALANWETTSIFSNKERLILQCAEELTLLDKDISKIQKLLKAHFLEREIVDIVACVSIMNALNRIAISLRD